MGRQPQFRGLRLFDRRTDHAQLLIAQMPVLAGVRIQAAHADARFASRQ